MNNYTSSQEAIQLSFIQSIYRTETVFHDVNGQKVAETIEVLDRQIPILKWIRKEAITSIEETCTPAGVIEKNKCIIFDRYAGKFFELFHSAGEVIRKVENTQPKREIGFVHDTAIHTGKSSVHKPSVRRDY